MRSELLQERNLIHAHQIAILLRQAASTNTTRPRRLTEVPVPPSVEAIRLAHAQLGLRLRDDRARRRLDNGLQFLTFAVDAAPVVSTWIATGARYLDELNWLLPIGSDDLWLRDVFVVPALRGQGLFANLVDRLATRGVQAQRRVWSDVDWDNRASMRAHVAAGFEVAHRVRAIELPGGLHVRSALPAWDRPVQEIRPGSRVLRLKGDVLQRHQELLA
jgi:GNAT superfamily N-acetyltransferase